MLPIPLSQINKEWQGQVTLDSSLPFSLFGGSISTLHPWIIEGVILHFTLAFSSGILRDKRIDNKFMYIPNDDKQSYKFCNSKLMVEKPTNHNSQKALKFLSQWACFKILGTSEIYNPMAPTSLILLHILHSIVMRCGLQTSIIFVAKVNLNYLNLQ